MPRSRAVRPRPAGGVASHMTAVTTTISIDDGERGSATGRSCGGSGMMPPGTRPPCGDDVADLRLQRAGRRHLQRRRAAQPLRPDAADAEKARRRERAIVDAVDAPRDLARQHRAEDQAEAPVEPRARQREERRPARPRRAASRPRRRSTRISRPIGGDVASTWPVMMTSAICSVKGISSQKPLPQASTICASVDGVATAPATTTISVASSANTNASGIQRSVHAVSASASLAITSYNLPRTGLSNRIRGSHPSHRQILHLMISVTAFAPATVSNVACGFDVLGFALESPGDEVIGARSPPQGPHRRHRRRRRPAAPRRGAQHGRRRRAGPADDARRAAWRRAHHPQGPAALERPRWQRGQRRGGRRGGRRAVQRAHVDRDAVLLCARRRAPRRRVRARRQHRARASTAASCWFAAPSARLVRLPVPPGSTAVVVHPDLEIETAQARHSSATRYA